MPSNSSTPNQSSQRPAPDRDAVQAPNAAPMNPGDEAPAGTPGTGENICPACHGSGRLRGAACASCGGSGRIVTGIGGA